MSTPTPTPTPTPLSEANANSLEELFSRGTLDSTDKDVDQIVEILRAQRVKWQKAQSEPKPRAVPKAVVDISAIDLDL